MRRIEQKRKVLAAHTRATVGLGLGERGWGLTPRGAKRQKKSPYSACQRQMDLQKQEQETAAAKKKQENLEQLFSEWRARDSEVTNQSALI